MRQIICDICREPIRQTGLVVKPEKTGVAADGVTFRTSLSTGYQDTPLDVCFECQYKLLKKLFEEGA